MAVQRYEEAIRLFVETSGDKELGALIAQLTKLGAGADAGAEQAHKLVAELDKLAQTGNNLRNVVALKAAIADTGNAIEAAREKQAALAAEFDRAEAPTKAMEKALARAAGQVTELTRVQNRQQAELGRTNIALQAAGVDTTKLADAYDHLHGQLDDVGRRANTAADAMARADAKGKDAAKSVGLLDGAAKRGAASLSSIATSLTAVAAKAAAAVTALAGLAGGALFVGAVKSATDVEGALSQVRAATNATAEEMAALKAAAESAGSTTRFSTLQAAQALNELARATGNSEAAIRALPATLSLAAAGQLDVADASQIVITALTQFGLGFDKAAHVADLFQTEAAATTDNVQSLGLAMGYAAPLAAQLGISLDDTTAILGALAQEGFKGEKAGTALRQTFSQLLDPTSEFSKALRGLGIESGDFATIMTELASKGDRGRDAILKLDAAATPAILSLTSKGGRSLRDLKTAIDGAAGSADAAAKVMGDNLSGAAESIKDSFDRTRRSLIEPLMGPLKDELFTLSTELEQFAQSPEFEQIKEALKELFVEGADAARDLIKNVDFKELAHNIRDAITTSGEYITEFKDNIGGLITAVEVVGQTFNVILQSVEAAVFAVASVVAKVVSGIAALVDGLSEPQRKLLEFMGLIEKGQGSLETFAGGMNAVAENFRDRFVANVHEAGDAMGALADAVGDVDNKAVPALAATAAASDAAADSAHGLADASQEAAAALAHQAQGASEAAAQTDSAAASMVDNAQRLKKAFADLGVTSQTDLANTAASAKHSFDLIAQAVADGTAKTEDAKRAFAAYAQAALAAVKDSDVATQVRVRGELQVRGATINATDALRELGLAGADAGDRVSGGANRAASSLAQVSDTAKVAAADVTAAGSAMDAAGDAAPAAADGVDKLTFSFGEMSQAAHRALLDANRYAGIPELFSKQINGVTAQFREQASALEEVNKQLDAQMATADPLADKLTALRAQYGFLGDAALRATAEKQLQLEKQAAAAQQAADTAAQQQRSIQAETRQATAPAGPARPLGASDAQPATARGVATKVIRVELPGEPGIDISVAESDEAALERLLERLVAMLSQRKNVSQRGQR